MNDQAHELRSLKMKTAAAESAERGACPRTIAVTGGKGGVGISTLVVNLAASLARQGKRVLVASVTEQPHDLALICGLPELPDPAACSEGRRQPILGPAGIMLLPAHETERESACSRSRRVFQQIAELDACVDIAIVDCGNRFAPMDHASASAIDMTLFVTTSDNVAVMDTYAAIKKFVGNCGGTSESKDDPSCHSDAADAGCGSTLPRLALLVNRCHETSAARCTHDRIAATSQRFLQANIQFLGDVPDDSSLCAAQVASLPAVVQSPTSAAARAIGRIAAKMGAIEPRTKIDRTAS